jgi:AbrB family looped-hinge helix DNA binding protein
MKYTDYRKGRVVMESVNAQAKITGKGQVQLPAVIRKRLGAEVGDFLVFKSTENGHVLLELRKQKRLTELAGALKATQPFPGVEAEEEETRRLWTEARQHKA